METVTVGDVVNESAHFNTSQDEWDSEYGRSVSRARYALNYVITPILCILGIVGNVLNIIVLRRCGFKDTNVLFLESLSLADLIMSVVHSVLHVHFIVELVDAVAASVIGTFSFIYLFGIYQMTVFVILSHLVAIAIERVIAVYFPFHVARIFTRPRVLACIVFLYSLGVPLFSPLYMIFEARWVDVPLTNRTMAILVPTQVFLTNIDIMNRYMDFGIGLLNDSVLPGTIVICCVAVGLKMWRRKKQLLPKLTKKKDGNDLNGVRLLMAVCAVSLMFAVPAITVNAYFFLYHEFSGPFHERRPLLFLTTLNII